MFFEFFAVPKGRFGTAANVHFLSYLPGLGRRDGSKMIAEICEGN
jgi:hypothetical protein